LVLVLDIGLFLLCGLSAVALFGQETLEAGGAQSQQLTAADQERLRQLNQLGETGGQLTASQRSELDRLTTWQQSARAAATVNARALAAVQSPRPLTPNQAARLRELQQRGQLTPTEVAELQNLQLRLVANQYPSLSDQQRQQLLLLYGQDARLLPPEQQAELLELERLRQSGQLQVDARNRLFRLQMQQDVSLRQNLAQELSQLQQIQQSGRRISPLQRQRLERLAAQRQQFTPFSGNVPGLSSPAQSPLGRTQSPLGQTQSPLGTVQSPLATPPGTGVSQVPAQGTLQQNPTGVAVPGGTQSATVQPPAPGAGTQTGAGANAGAESIETDGGSSTTIR
jgi:hypothetical protein